MKNIQLFVLSNAVEIVCYSGEKASALIDITALFYLKNVSLTNFVILSIYHENFQQLSQMTGDIEIKYLVRWTII
jgi:hypothetical protein